MKSAHDPRRHGIRRELRALAGVWIALLALMSLSLASAYLRLGPGNVVVGLVIATTKAALVVWWFMSLRRASAMTRIAAAAGLATLLLLMTLSLTDYTTRIVEPARWQSPKQIAPWVGAAQAPPGDSRHHGLGGGDCGLCGDRQLQDAGTGVPVRPMRTGASARPTPAMRDRARQLEG